MDNFFVKMFQREATRREVTTTNPSASENQPKVSTGSFEERIIRVTSPQLALTVSAVYRAVELRAKTESQFLIQYQKKNPAGGNYIEDNYGIARNINWLLQVEPNPISTISSLIEQAVARRLLWGNSFIYIERDEYGDPRHLWLAECGGYNQISGTYTLTYLSGDGIRVKVDVPRRDVLHFANTFRRQEGFWGISTIAYAVDALTLTKTEGSQALESAAKGGRMKLLVGEDTSKTFSPISAGMFDKAQVDKYARELNDKVYSQDVVGMRGLDKVQNISLTAQEMQQMEMLNMGLDDVARFFGTPRPLLMLDTNSHYTTYTNATLEYLQRTVQPDINEMEQELNRKLLSREDFGRRRIHMCEQPLLRLDKEAQAKVDQLQLQTGAASVNEIRQQYDRPSVEGGDTIYVSTNLAELGSEKLRGTTPAVGGSPVDTPNENEEKGGPA